MNCVYGCFVAIYRNHETPNRCGAERCIRVFCYYTEITFAGIKAISKAKSKHNHSQFYQITTWFLISIMFGSIMIWWRPKI